MIIWQILGFFLPALKPNERRWVVPTVLAATALFFIWCSARIYRVGILMYGKKPSIKEMIKWMRYK